MGCEVTKFVQFCAFDLGETDPKFQIPSINEY